MLKAGVRDDGVEPPVEPLERGVDDGAVALARRQVGVVDVDGVNVRPAVGGQPLGDRGADAATAPPRHERSGAPVDDHWWSPVASERVDLLLRHPQDEAELDPGDPLAAHV